MYHVSLDTASILALTEVTIIFLEKIPHGKLNILHLYGLANCDEYNLIELFVSCIIAMVLHLFQVVPRCLHQPASEHSRTGQLRHQRDNGSVTVEALRCRLV